MLKSLIVGMCKNLCSGNGVPLISLSEAEQVYVHFNLNDIQCNFGRVVLVELLLNRCTFEYDTSVIGYP